MGRYNNKRTQAAAQAAKNTPSRARFSKGPPGGNKKRGNAQRSRNDDPPPKTKSRGIGGGNYSSGNNKNGANGRRGRNPQTTARVIDKIQNRVGRGTNPGSNQPGAPGSGSTAAAAARSNSSGNNPINKSTEIALKNLDKSKLDVVAVSKETQNLISDLLRELGVVGGTNTPNSSNNNNNNSSRIAGMNPNATEYSPDVSVDPHAIIEEDSEANESDDHDDYSGSSSEDDYQDMMDFLTEQSEARTVHAGMDPQGDGGGGLDGDETDDYNPEMQRLLVANRRRKEEQQQQEENQDKDGDTSIADRSDPGGDGNNETTETISNGNVGSENQTNETNESNEKNNNNHSEEETASDFENDHTYLHLTTNLSFPHVHAAKACRAIECWETNIGEGTTSEPTSSNNTDQKNNGDDDNRLELAMDWLCLHLSEADLNKGFRPNPSASTNAFGKNQSPKPLSVTPTRIKAVSHPSISVISKPIAEQAKEWAEAVALQERVLKFIRLGFHRADALAAFERAQIRHGFGRTRSVVVTEDPALPLLLSQLQDGALSGSGSSEEVDVQSDGSNDDNALLEEAKEEREQELEALKAIYDDRLRIVYREGNSCAPTSEIGTGECDSDSDSDADSIHDGRIPERYILQIDPATPLGDPARADEIFLHVILRDRYPSSQTPLLLLVTRPTLPPSLSRNILTRLGEKAREIIGLDFTSGERQLGGGCPVVFETVSYLEDNLPALHRSFCNEQRRKEFEAQQARLLRQRQVEMEESEKAMELLYDAAANKSSSNQTSGANTLSIGRRQRAKLRAAEKAYDRPDQQKALYEEYRRKQTERVNIARAENQSANVRATHAQKAILKRQKELIDEEANNAFRRAMNEAFRKGQSREEARAAAEKARIASYRENGVTVTGEKETTKETSPQVSDAGADKDTNTDKEMETKVSKPTEASSKFMERLRNSAPRKTATEDSTHISSNDQAPGSKKEMTQGPTPHTSAFMDRLREMYDSAARAKHKKESDGSSSNNHSNSDKTVSQSHGNKLDGYHLDIPNDDANSGEEDSANESGSTYRPRPVAVPAGELVGVMEDIIHQQEDQPWLVSPEARAPTTTSERKEVPPAQLKREKEISAKLRTELSRKRKLAREWAETQGADQPQCPKAKRGNKKKKQGNGTFTAQRFHEMMTMRQRLPAFQISEELVQTIDRNQVTVIAGATGCGKTTQVPQLVLDDLIQRGLGAVTNMIVTQPRRISAIGVSERIAQERCEKVGETCGYSIKLEKKMSAKTRLLLCTTGVLLRRLQCDPDLASVSHIFVDEVHERDLNTDFLIIILKDLLARRKNLKLVLMSATLNADSFSSYFGGCPVVSIAGRAYPVQENRLEDILELTGYSVEEGGDYALKTGPNRPVKMSKSALRRLYYPKYSKETIHSLSIVDENVINYELIAELLEHISLNQGEGAILVFCPGFAEITKTIEEMYKKEYFQGPNVVIYPLHSSLSTDEQVAIFEIPPEGVRKIVVSTNIAETSITIEDVVFVVDTGRVKENRRDEVNETPTLEECWVSRASAKQRRGRAGRVRPGIAYHLYSSHTHDDDMLEYQLPEMLRVGIEDLVLQILILDLGEPTSFLKKALDPPSNLALSNSLKLLEELGAVDCQWKNRKSMAFSSKKEKENAEDDLDVSSELTALGFHLATLPVDPRVGKMMIYGALFGCVDPLLTFAAAMSARSPFVSPFDARDQADAARKTFAVAGSDHLTILNAFNQWSELRRTEGNRVVNEFLKENFLGRLTLFQMEDLRKQFHSLLTDIGFLPRKFRLKDSDHACNNNSRNQGLIKAVLCAGLYPNIIVAPRSVVAKPGLAPKKSNKKVGENAFRSHSKGEVYLHPSTIAFDESKLESRYCCYHELIRTSKTYVRDCTTVSPFALLLFGGTLEVFQTHGVCSVDGWLKFKIDAKPATLIKYLRGKMERLLFQKIVSPHEDVIESEEGKALIQSISRLFETEEQQRKVEAAKIPDRRGGEIVRPWTGIEDENERLRDIQEEANRRNSGNRNGTHNSRRSKNTESCNGRDNNNPSREGRGGRGRGGKKGGRSGMGRGSRR